WQISSNKVLAEGQIRDIFSVVLPAELSGWLTTEQAHREIIDEVKDKHRGKTSDEEVKRCSDKLLTEGHIEAIFQVVQTSEPLGCWVTMAQARSTRRSPRA